MIYIGIDGGLSGAIVAIDSDRNIIAKHAMPIIKGDRNEYDIQEIIKIFCSLKEKGEPMTAVLEKAQMVPVSGKIAAFSTGFCLGMMQGILTALRIPFQVVSPRTWQKEVLRDISGKDTKQRSILFCKRMFPDESWKRTEKCEKNHDGMTDAACIAYWGTISRGEKNGRKSHKKDMQ